MKGPRAGEASAGDWGYTLAELLVVLLIIAILLLVAIAAYVPATVAATAAACRHNQTALEKAVPVASGSGAEPPAQLSDLAAYVTDFDEVSTCPSDGTTLVLDATTGDISCPNHP